MHVNGGEVGGVFLVDLYSALEGGDDCSGVEGEGDYEAVFVGVIVGQILDGGNCFGLGVDAGGEEFVEKGGAGGEERKGDVL